MTQSTQAQTLTPTDSSPQRWLAPAMVVLCGLLAYLNCFGGSFVLDDYVSLPLNPQLTSLSLDTGKSLSTLAGRPVLHWTFALETRAAGLNPTVYHATNLVIHLFNALLLYAILLSTFSNRQFWANRFERSATWLAAAVAALWATHPLTTQAVTYIIQRAESLASLFYLATLYCSIRAMQKPGVLWQALAILACLLGMGTKEMLVTAPVIVLFYDRVFVAGSFAEALKKRWPLYSGLGATWIVLGLLLSNNPRGAAVGFDLDITSMQYFRTQLNVVAHYLRLSVWPTALVLDEFGWPIAKTWQDVTAGGWLVVMLALASAVGFWKKSPLGFLGCWFFVILSPSSSFVPIVTEVAAEQRMYLPLIAVVVLVCVGGWEVFRRLKLEWLAYPTVAALLVLFIWMTHKRNQLYHSEQAMWQDTLSKRPNNARAHFGLGTTLVYQNRPDLAAQEFFSSLKLKPDYHQVVHWLGQALLSAGRIDLAEQFCADQINHDKPLIRDAYFLRGSIRHSRGDLEGARSDFQATVTLAPKDPDVHYALARVLEDLQQWPQAREEFRKTLELSPNYQDASTRMLHATMMMQASP